MLKLIYLAKAKPGFTFDDFVRRWRMHGARSMEMAFHRHTLGYVQAEPIRPAPVAGASEEFDAVACLMLRNDAFAEPPDAEETRSILDDELETFAGPVTNGALWVNEARVVDGELGGVTAFRFFANAAAARRAAHNAESADGLHRICLNTRNDDTPLGPDANTLPYEAVVELAARSMPALAASLPSAPNSELDPATELRVITREVVMWDRMAGR